ncbi:unnamed protein product [Rotaria sp. Silwood2]|nr:unnamed protein product [Rotaria sp. Silwood2]CAF2473243.1 unnamed protein product [Rotaria sp. Silwood2]CAF2708946.1 unnamed protein product [Rotaria sp. Silwood2]CAF2860183.1 unnamed protein product [Rotaria sp. Silwood2]CAF3858421.1 unnamed protein product [Rotaria sp. Silwood2]
MIMKKIILLVIVFLLSPIINCLASNSFYLLRIDNNLLSNESYCSNILINQHIYRIPKQCHYHLLCNSYNCDDQSFRCTKIRETLCCLYKYFQLNCQEDNFIRIKDLFRSVYFYMSIEHGYCEINLERIEKNDQTYCISNIEETKIITTQTLRTIVSSTVRSSFKYFHRRPSSLHPHRVATRQNYSSLTSLDYLRQVTIIENVTSKCSKIFIDCFLIIIFLLSILI